MTPAARIPVGLMLIAGVTALWPSYALAIGGRGGGGGGGGRGRAGGAAGRPAPRPAPRPQVTQRPQVGAQARPRPNARPEQRPSARPGGASQLDRPNKRPEKLPGKDGLANRPTTLPSQRPRPGSFPDFGGEHGIGGGNFGGGNLGGGDTGGGRRPLPRPGGRPTTLPAKVNPGQLGDFLGIEGVRPNQQRPAWQQLKPNQVNNIHNQWNVAVGNKQNNFHNWTQLHPDRGDYWRGWGNNVRRGWTTLPARPWFNNHWWATHPGVHGWWHYSYATRPWSYWWTVPTWTGVSAWFAPYGWTGGNYYDYGAGGNVVYQDNRVFVDGQEVASEAEFAQSAAELAAVEPPTDEQAAASAEWLPLGTFSLSLSADDTELTRVVQLAVSKDGVVSGTLYNTQTDQYSTLQGQVDKQTQRVAVMAVDRAEVVLETGLFNLTQDEAPAMVHYGDEKSAPALLVRLEQPAQES